MKQGQGLELKQTQKLSPLQILTIKLIELPIQELNQKVRAEFESNPVLEESSDAENVSLDELEKEDDGNIKSYNLHINNWGKDPRPEYNTFYVRQSFQQGLMDQLGFRNLSEKENEIARFIIGSLDKDGYLRRDVDTLVDDLAFRAGIQTDRDEVLKMLSVVQEFEPSGVAARDLQECLLLQLKSLKRTEAVLDAEKIIGEEFQEFSNRHFQKIMTRLGLTEERLKAAVSKIVRLNPSPGEQTDEMEQTQQIIPDFILEDRDGKLSFSMPKFSVPELRVNRKYKDMLRDAEGASERARNEVSTFVKQKLDSAKWFVEALRQRQNTLRKTMQAILDYQYEYFADGDESNLRPMVLKDIAEVTGFDISTISRVVNSKYIETHFGIFPLKYFFSEGMENKDGDEVSTRELKKALQECVDGEDKKKPLTDEQLVEEMGKRGYKVARRTIAKYRGQLGIPLARWRREL